MKKRNSNECYYTSVEDVKGQLELGSKNRKPHYQLWLRTKIKIIKKKLLEALSYSIYEEKTSNAISVAILSMNDDDMQKYCLKENNADLCEEYGHVQITKSAMDFQVFLEENPESKKYWMSRMLTINGS